MYSGPFGIGLKYCGTVFVNRASSEAGRKAVNEAGSKAKASGTSLFLFPEGTRHRGGGGTMLPFKKGAFHVALDTNMPILPIVIEEYEFMGPTRREQFPKGQTIRIRILEPIETDGYSKETVDDLIKETRDTMVSSLQDMMKTSSNQSQKQPKPFHE